MDFQVAYAKKVLPRCKRVGSCLLWQGPTNSAGYGGVKVGSPTFGVHVVAFAATHGYVPPVTRHTCDTPRCVNPEHLLPGTVKDNKQDMIDRDRSCTGTKHHAARLTDEQVLDIRRRYKRGNGRLLAEEFGVGYKAISKIVRGERWKHLTKDTGTCPPTP